MKNKLFLDRMTEELIRKGTLLYSDVQRIKSIHPVKKSEGTS